MEIAEKELLLTKKIINNGLSKAAKSMAFFTKDDVVISSADVKWKPLSFLGSLLDRPADQELTVLTTEIIGEIDGICYLIFSKEEVNKILSVTLPDSILKDADKTELMGPEMLLEMDNIITASVITEIANDLNAKMYGNVPEIEKTGTSGFSTIIETAKKTADYFLYFKSQFKTKGLDINPDFIWLLNKNYFEGVKKVLANNEENLTA